MPEYKAFSVYFDIGYGIIDKRIKKMNGEIKTVQDLIDELQAIENKNLPVFIYEGGDIFNINFVDAMNDRVDLNMEWEER